MEFSDQIAEVNASASEEGDPDGEKLDDANAFVLLTFIVKPNSNHP
jgi:hypothetical protein